jgi:hypothetical protein
METLARKRITNVQDCDLARYIRAHRNPEGVSEEVRRFYTEYQLEEERKRYAKE